MHSWERKVIRLLTPVPPFSFWRAMKQNYSYLSRHGVTINYLSATDVTATQRKIHVLPSQVESVRLGIIIAGGVVVSTLFPEREE